MTVDDVLLSDAEKLAARGPAAWAEITAGLTAQELDALDHDWRFWARPDQLLPADAEWSVLIWRTGRGWGKTRAECEAVRERKETVERIAVVGRTAADVRDTLVEGESGFLATAPAWDRPEYEPSKRRLTWRNGARATLFSADEPDALRGPQHGFAMCDELASWRYLDESWDNLTLGMRLGAHPQIIVGTTPRPRKKLREIEARPKTRVVTGSTYRNLSNLSPTFRDEVLSLYEGTRLGEQELHGRVLDDVPGALWERAWIDETRIKATALLREHIARIIIGVDPAVTSGEKSDATGIIAAARLISPCPFDGADKRPHYAVMRDASLRATPLGWAKRAVDVYDELDADKIVGEANNGGEMVEAMVKQVDRSASFRAVHASRGKAIRAEPVSGLYEQRRVHHAGTFAELEDQMCMFTPDAATKRGTDGEHWDRLDANVWAISELSARAALRVT